MNEDNFSTNPTAEQFAAVAVAVAAYERAAGYGRPGTEGRLSACGVVLEEVADALRWTEPSVAWLQACFCEAPPGDAAKFALATAVSEWLWHLELERRGDVPTTREDLVEEFADDAVWGFEVEGDAADGGRREVALRVSEAISRTIYGQIAGDLAAPTEQATLLSVTGWWREAARAVNEYVRAERVLEDLTAARDTHLELGLGETQAHAMAVALAELKVAVDQNRPVDVAALGAGLAALDTARLIRDEGSECRHQGGRCLLPVLPWTDLLV
ncbi:hypothetical protein [Demequina rhizosphaerae]|uniref:hypothetical protein n=1 Tax=Demequina rhizosphaerae TaxID=1638985 RepID=UPI0007813A2D|nr:hypothetical protein [Demequina rhizosphaerae]